MRFVRAFAGLLLLVVGLPALLAGGGLWLVTRHADPSGAFTARFETVQTAGHAVVVADVDRLLRRDVPFARVGQAGLRIEARTPDGPAFLGLAPTEEVRRWLEAVPHATVRRVAPARGPLPVWLDAAGAAPTAARPTVAPNPVGASIWVRDGIGALEWTPGDLAGRSLSLVVMRPDARADLTLDLRAELRVGWTAAATWGLLAGGVLLVTFAVLLLFRPVRPREVVFVVEPDQVPVLAGRLGVTSLSGLGARPAVAGDRLVVAQRQLAAVGSPAAPSAIPAVPARRPASLADVVDAESVDFDPVPASVRSAGGADAERRPSGQRASRPPVTLTLAWPAVEPERTARPVPVDGRGRPLQRRAANPNPDR
ncbi:hypothetical protein OG994_18725 [Micromonospora globbae]|jgi:hypothetical protein|uniref:Uncharacterized protein n=1 Tax=Micromonospora globbae TaxID=1894969 RepID=A0A420ESX1_9ACTN|nr:hypothetical protein [Micromonospora globbae]RKF23743.1 hypothetical protein D7I43_29725 [Micromonospora globbae]